MTVLTKVDCRCSSQDPWLRTTKQKCCAFRVLTDFDAASVAEIDRIERRSLFRCFSKTKHFRTAPNAVSGLPMLDHIRLLLLGIKTGIM